MKDGRTLLGANCNSISEFEINIAAEFLKMAIPGGDNPLNMKKKLKTCRVVQSDEHILLSKDEGQKY